MTVVVQPAIMAIVRTASAQVGTPVQLPPLIDVPVIFAQGGGFALTFPIQEGDEVLVIFAQRCIDNWWAQGGVQQQAEIRMYDISDGFAIPGICSLPNVVPDVSFNSVQLRSKDKKGYFEILEGGIVRIVAPQGNVQVVAQTITIQAPQGVTIEGNLKVTGSLTVEDDASIENIDFASHIHSGVQSGSGQSGPPV